MSLCMKLPRSHLLSLYQVFPKMRMTRGIPGILFKKKPVSEDPPLGVKPQVHNFQDILWSTEKIRNEASWREMNCCSLRDKFLKETSELLQILCYRAPFCVLPFLMDSRGGIRLSASTRTRSIPPATNTHSSLLFFKLWQNGF